MNVVKINGYEQTGSLHYTDGGGRGEEGLGYCIFSEEGRQEGGYALLNL